MFCGWESFAHEACTRLDATRLLLGCYFKTRMEPTIMQKPNIEKVCEEASARTKVNERKVRYIKKREGRNRENMSPSSTTLQGNKLYVKRIIKISNIGPIVPLVHTQFQFCTSGQPGTSHPSSHIVLTLVYCRCRRPPPPLLIASRLCHLFCMMHVPRRLVLCGM